MNKQVQKGGANSTNFQVEELNVVQGLSYPEVRQVAIDVFKANFYELAGEAKVIAAERAEQVTEDFLNKLQKENPHGFTKSQDPDFQHALFTVQKEYARTGDEDLGDLLVDLLVDRSKQEQRDILQIVLNESLSIAPKLTKDQLSALAINFLFRYTQNYAVGNHKLLGDYFDKHVQPFSSSLPKNSASYQHLQFSGCGSVSMGSISLEQIIGETYQGLFLKGFDIQEIANREISIGQSHDFFIPCLNDREKWQVRANSKEILEKKMETLNVPQTDRPKILALFNQGKMNNQEIKSKCIEIRPYMENVFDVWADSDMQSFSLTSVGISIGHANLKRLVGEFANLSIWIN
ncbi:MULTISPECIES: LPO_1073/Vpar_1526 family protein [Vibrio]|uniref:LPO_1073/Vpar_1526 family protein n=1 Tax=Vibrio TaxID=662 RepID=UPI000C163A5D|nr:MULTISPECIES: LPO_1073/Vpar_1526 family protein [Vibrio]